VRRQRRKKRDARGSCHGAGASEAAWVGLTLLAGSVRGAGDKELRRA